MSPAPVSQARKRRLGDLLIAAGVLDETRLKAALAEQKKWGGKLGRTLVEMGFIDEKVMVQVLGAQLHLQIIDLDSAKLPERIIDALRLDLAERYGVFPVQSDPKGRTLHVATSDPTNVESLNALAFATTYKIVPVVCTGSGIDRAIRRHYFGERTTPTFAATPEQVGLKETAYELDELMGEPARTPTGPQVTRPRTQEVPAQADPELRKELALLREQVDSVEKIVASQVRALRSLLELLIEAGLISRDEYLQKLHRLD